MKTILDITNREEIVEKLAELLMQFEKELNNYQTDVYMYIDQETGTATLDTFVKGRQKLFTHEVKREAQRRQSQALRFFFFISLNFLHFTR